jgi:two-component system LytT family response regulator
MINAIIIDDEKNARDTMASLLELYCEDVKLAGQAANISEGEALILKLKPDLVFLDIDMPGGSGFDLLKKYKEVPFKIIFVTAYQEHAVKAFKFSALDYLLKPVNPDELVKAVAKAEDAISKNKLSDKLEVFMNTMQDLNRTPKKIVLKTADNIHIINVGEIVRCEADGNYSSFHVLNKKPILVSNTLKEYDEMLSAQGFFRAHQSHLININQVERYEKKDGGCLIMKDGSQIPVAVRKKEELLSLLQGI